MERENKVAGLSARAVRIAAAAAAAASLACAATPGAAPVLQFRLEIEHTLTDEAWARTSSMLKSVPGLCDEIWFGTGFGMPTLETHRRNAEGIRRAAGEVRALGWRAGLQIQATIGHGGPFCEGKDYSGRDWTGWTNSGGAEDKYCNCPRDPRFLAYMRETARIYAALRPSSVWIDDDLRIDAHGGISRGSLDGCWCDRCIKDFNAQTGGSWTRGTLERQARRDERLRREFERFSIGSIAAVARAIGEEFHAVSPETLLGVQNSPTAVRTVKALVAALRDAAGGRPAGFRPGSGAYYDTDPNLQILKALATAQCRRDFALDGAVGLWTSEIACFPRTYGTKSARTISMEAFAALVNGMDAASALVLNYGKEPEDLYLRTRLKPMEEAADVLREYAKSSAGTQPAGFAAPVGSARLYWFARSGVPALFGPGKTLAAMSRSEASFDPTTASTAQVQALRDMLDARAGGSPAVLESPFTGLMTPRVAKDGTLRNVALLGLRLDEQGPLVLRLRNVPHGVTKAVWRELRRQPVELALQPTDEPGLFRVAIPSIAPWNGGFLHFPPHR